MAKNKSISVNILGADELLLQLDNLTNQIQIGAQEGINKAILKVKELAIILAPANDGQLRNSIKTITNPSELIAEAYVDIGEVPYAMYVYYGTGAYARLSGTGKTQWLVPIEKVTKDTTKYAWTVHKGKNGYSDYYIVRGQEAKPFLEWAMASTKELNIDLIKQEVKLAIERCL